MSCPRRLPGGRCGAGFLLLATCTALVLKALPGFGVAASVGLVSAVALAWVVVGAQLPKMVRAEPGAAPDPGRISAFHDV